MNVQEYKAFFLNKDPEEFAVAVLAVLKGLSVEDAMVWACRLECLSKI